MMQRKKDQNDQNEDELEVWNLFGPTHTPYRVLFLGKMLDRLTTSQVKSLADLTLAEWRVLAHLGVMGKKSASDICSAAMMDRAEVSRSVSRLAERGLLKRSPNPRNKKSQLLSLTAKGTKVYVDVQKHRLGFFGYVTQDLSKKELAQLDEFLLRIAKRTTRLEHTQARLDDFIK
ncbi:MarR family winged helix-turn-helix transcriptional regulator [Marinicaulis aureus]|uniref:MarR family winged helix-turn-helix transcriptional regulator n=1 Tax=Hyphococcus aureus TaxID=2666033 RepID=A0ABW1KU74_9PROT